MLRKEERTGGFENLPSENMAINNEEKDNGGHWEEGYISMAGHTPEGKKFQAKGSKYFYDLKQK